MEKPDKKRHLARKIYAMVERVAQSLNKIDLTLLQTYSFIINPTTRCGAETQRTQWS